MQTPSPLHIVICDHRNGPYVPERNIAEMTRAETIKDIATGQIENIRTILSVEIGVTGIVAEDVTKDIAWAVCQQWQERNRELTNREFDWIWTHCGHSAANAFRRAA